jgi:hypothetical protein
MGDEPRGPVDALVVPRFAGPSTFARLPRLDEVSKCDVAVLGVPFDSRVTYRPGARFGPAAIRQGSRLLRPSHCFDPTLGSQPGPHLTNAWAHVRHCGMLTRSPRSPCLNGDMEHGQIGPMFEARLVSRRAEVTAECVETPATCANCSREKRRWPRDT